MSRTQIVAGATSPARSAHAAAFAPTVRTCPHNPYAHPVSPAEAQLLRATDHRIASVHSPCSTTASDILLAYSLLQAAWPETYYRLREPGPTDMMSHARSGVPSPQLQSSLPYRWAPNIWTIKYARLACAENRCWGLSLQAVQCGAQAAMWC